MRAWCGVLGVPVLLSLACGAGDDDGIEVTHTPGRFFPDQAWMYRDISEAAVDPRSDTITRWLEDNGGWGLGRLQIDFSIEVLGVSDSTPYRSFEPTGDFYDPDCDDVDVPVPAGGALEGESGYACESDGDCHLIVADERDGRLYEMWRANIAGDTFEGGCLAAWDMTRAYGAEGRGDQCSSADAAGFPIAPLLFTADEVADGEIAHALRFALPNERMRANAFVHPGTHAGGPEGPADAPVYGSRWRLRADFDMGRLPDEGARTVARALQQYGMALADGGNVALMGRTDRSTTAKWDGLLDPHDMTGIEPTDFEVIDTGDPIALTYDCQRTAY